jgi:ligand-binding sensor domain-containing protein
VDVGSDIITDISSDGLDNIYVATDGNGVHFISHAAKQIVRSFRYEPRAKNGIRSNSIYSLLVDRNNNIWVGFYQAGLDYSLYQNPIFDLYNFPPFFDSNGLPVRAFLISDKQKLIGTREGLYYINEQNNTVKFFNKKELRSNLVLSLIFHKDEYYIGTYGGGVSVLNPQTMKARPLTNDFTLLKDMVSISNKMHSAALDCNIGWFIPICERKK